MAATGVASLAWTREVWARAEINLTLAALETSLSSATSLEEKMVLLDSASRAITRLEKHLAPSVLG